MKSTGLVFSPRSYIGSAAPPSTTIEDESRNRNTGTLTGATWTRLPYGIWVNSYDGSTSYADCLSANFPIGNSGRTILAWVNPTSFSDYDSILSYGTAVAYQTFFLSFYTTAGSIIVGRYGGNADAPSDTNLIAGVWDLAGVTFTGSSVIYYKSGVADGTATMADADTVLSACRIGTNHWATTANEFTGSMLPPLVLDWVLPPGKIKQYYESTRHLFGI